MSSPESRIPDRIPALLHAIASAARPPGSAFILAARQRCAAELRSEGYEIHELPFEFSEFPGRFATSLVGAAAALTVGFAGKLGVAGDRVIPILVLVLGGMALTGAGVWMTRRGVLETPLLRQRGVNLEAMPPGPRPRVWLCAHLDSKSQPVPTLVRVSGIILEGLGYLSTLALAAAAAAGAVLHPTFWLLAALLTFVGSLPVVLSIVSWRSPGALDNASGVVAVIEAARAVKTAGVGILITDAEELGLAGARVWAGRNPGVTVLNCDGVDDTGAAVAMFTGRRPARVLGAIISAVRTAGVPCEPMRMIPGVLTDSVAFADGGIESVTFSRGTWRSLARVHSGRDSLKHLRGTGIADVATLMSATALELARSG